MEGNDVFCAPMTTPRFTVKQQTEIRSKQWGVYDNGVLIEGGFFSRDAANDCAMSYMQSEYRDNENARRVACGLPLCDGLSPLPY